VTTVTVAGVRLRLLGPPVKGRRSQEDSGPVIACAAGLDRVNVSYRGRLDPSRLWSDRGCGARGSPGQTRGTNATQGAPGCAERATCPGPAAGTGWNQPYLRPFPVTRLRPQVRPRPGRSWPPTKVPPPWRLMCRKRASRVRPIGRKGVWRRHTERVEAGLCRAGEAVPRAAPQGPGSRPASRLSSPVPEPPAQGRPVSPGRPVLVDRVAVVEGQVHELPARRSPGHRSPCAPGVAGMSCGASRGLGQR
jgi:hypothetical protein